MAQMKGNEKPNLLCNGTNIWRGWNVFGNILTHLRRRWMNQQDSQFAEEAEVRKLQGGGTGSRHGSMSVKRKAPEAEEAGSSLKMPKEGLSGL